MGMITIGRFAVPVTLVLLAASLSVALFVSSRRSAEKRARIDSALQHMLLAGIVIARLSFVFAYWDTYRVAPITMLDIRDGGFHPWAGVIGAAAVAFVYVWRNRSLLRPLALAISAGGATAAVVAVIAWTVLERPRDTGLPAGIFTSLDGRPMQFDSFSGRPVVVNLWASWCPPCRREMPAFAEAQAQNSDIVFVFANQGETAEAARAYLQKESIDVQNVLLDPRMTIGRHAGSAALPTTMFFNRDGKLVNVRMGELSAASLAQQLAPLQREQRN